MHVDIISLQLCDSLRQLDMIGARYVDHGAIRRLLAACPRMEVLDVAYCELLASEEAHRELYALRREFPNCHITNAFS